MEASAGIVTSAMFPARATMRPPLVMKFICAPTIGFPDADPTLKFSHRERVASVRYRCAMRALPYRDWEHNPMLMVSTSSSPG
jgi:hypothetical protein